MQVVQAQHSADGETTKLLLELQDGLTVESVIMHYDTSGAGLLESGCAHLVVQRLLLDAACSWFPHPTLPCHSSAPFTGVTDAGRGDSDADSCMTAGGSRATLCVSSEVGCQMGCTFCATGTMGLKVAVALCPEMVRCSLMRVSSLLQTSPYSELQRSLMQGDLTSGEIIEQLVHARALTPIRNVVFMGMGVSVVDLLCPWQALVTAHPLCDSLLTPFWHSLCFGPVMPSHSPTN